MKSLLFGVLMFIAMPSAISAQEAGGYHPFLSDKFNIGIGVFSPQKSFEIRVDGSIPGEEVDFGESLSVDESEVTPSAELRWRFGDKWSLWGQYWKVESGGGAILTKDVKWNDLVFKEGTFASAGVDVSVMRVFFGRTFHTGPKHEFGLGAGLHWMEIGAFLEGEVILEEGGTGFQKGDVDAAFPLPNIGAWYMYSWSPKWIAQVRADWLSVSIGDYSGGLWSGSAGIHFQAFERIGFGLSYSNFNLDVDVDKENWRGSAETQQHGPRLTMTALW